MFLKWAFLKILIIKIIKFIKYSLLEKPFFHAAKTFFFSCGWASRLRQKVCENNDFPMRVYTSSACQNKKSWNIINFQKLKPQPLPRSPPLLCRRRPSEAKLAAPPPDPRARGRSGGWISEGGRQRIHPPPIFFHIILTRSLHSIIIDTIDYIIFTLTITYF